MKICILSLDDPWTHTDGGSQRTRAFTATLSKLGHTVVSVYRGGGAGKPAPLTNVRFIPVLPDAAGTRAWPDMVRRTKRRYLPMPTVAGARSPAIDHVLAEQDGVELLIVSQLSAARFIQKVPGAALWLDLADVWSEFAGREADQRTGVARRTARLQQALLRKTEKAAGQSAAIVTAAGWTDAQVLGAATGVRVHWLPSPVSVDEVAVREATQRHKGRVAGFLGNFSYWPNQDALKILASVWAPKLTGMGWDVLIAGYASEDQVLPANIRCLGTVDSVGAFYREVDIALAPIRLGGGMKVKIAEALLYHKTVVGSSFALEGFPPELRRDMLCVDLLEPDFARLLTGRQTPLIANPSLMQFAPEEFTRQVASCLAGTGK